MLQLLLFSLFAACEHPPRTLDECLLRANEKADVQAMTMAQENCRDIFRIETAARAYEAKYVDPLMRVGGYYAVGAQKCQTMQWGMHCYGKGCLCYENRWEKGVLLCDKEHGGPTRLYKLAWKESSVVLRPEDGSPPVEVFREEADCVRAAAAAKAPR